MADAISFQKTFAPLLPGLLGIEMVEATAERVVATLKVRPDLCTIGDTLHGGALMAFADTLGAIGTVINLPEHARTHDDRVEHEVRRAGARRRDGHRRMHAVSPRQHDDGVADAGEVAERQDVRDRHADTACNRRMIRQRIVSSKRSSLRPNRILRTSRSRADPASRD